MNDFVALLLAVAAFCAAYVALGALVRASLALELAPYALAEGSLAQLALAGLAARRAWLRVRPGPGPARA